MGSPGTYVSGGLVSALLGRVTASGWAAAGSAAGSSGAGEGAGACPIPAGEPSIVGRSDAEKRPDGCQ